MCDLCIGCSEIDVHAEHPLFEGGLCKGCKVREKEEVGLAGCIYSSSDNKQSLLVN